MCNGGYRSVRRGQKVSNRQLGDLTHCANPLLRVGGHKSRTATTAVIMSSIRAKDLYLQIYWLKNAHKSQFEKTDK